MTDNISLTGVVATPPRSLRTNSGLAICSFRLASPQRRFDRHSNEWVEGETNWYTITAFRTLADNVAASIVKGDRVSVAGRLRIRPWETDERSGTTVEVDADTVGHDLLWGTTVFSRTMATKRVDVAAADSPSTPSTPEAPEPADAAGGAPESAASAGHDPGMHDGVPLPADPPGETPVPADRWAPSSDERPF